MKIICKSRGTGKTKELIQLSIETGTPIFALTTDRANEIVEKSFRYFGKPCKVVTPGNIEESEEILIDDAEVLLQMLVKQRFNDATIKAITVTTE